MMRKRKDRTANVNLWFALGCGGLVVLLTFLMPAAAKGQNADTQKLVIELFVRPDSEQCKHAEEFLDNLSDRREGIEIKTYDVTADREALARLWKLSKQFGKEKAQLPTAYFCNSIKVGFRDAETTGREIESYLTLRAFVRPDCPHCSDAKKFLGEFAKRWPAIKVEYLDVINEAKAREEAEKVTVIFGKKIVSFPCLHVAGRLVVGFQSADTTGKQIEDFFKDRSVSTSPEGKSSESGESKADSKSETQSKSLGPRNLDSSAKQSSARMAWPADAASRASFFSGFGSLTLAVLPGGQTGNGDRRATGGQDSLLGDESKKKLTS